MAKVREIEFEDIEDSSDESSYYIVMWCCEGLECIVPVDMDKMGDGANMLAKLEDKENKYPQSINRTLWALQLRASANLQRSYEIYYLTTSKDITKECLERYFDDSPQMIVDLIREKGQKLYSDRGNTVKIID